MITTVLLWIALGAGIVPTAWFVLQFRPSWPITEAKWAALIIWALPASVLLGYLRIAVVLALRGGVARPLSWVDATVSILPLVVIDAAVIPLLLLARKYRARWMARRREEEERKIDD